MNGLRYDGNGHRTGNGSAGSPDPISSHHPGFVAAAPMTQDKGTTQQAPRPGHEKENGRSDEQLMADYRHGDRTSFAELVGRYERELYHFLVRFLGDRAA